MKTTISVSEETKEKLSKITKKFKFKSLEHTLLALIKIVKDFKPELEDLK